MRAILLAAGFGTRLRPLTDTIPKCLVPIKGEPLLGIWLDRLTQANIDSFLVNTHYLSHKVDHYLKKSQYSNKIIIKTESELLGTAGTLIENQSFFQGEDGLLIHADNYCLADFKAFIHAHYSRPPECLITMMLFKTETPSSCGIVELDDKKIVIGFHEKVESPPGNLANGAVYILSKEFLQLLKSEFAETTDFSTEILPKMIHRIFTYETHDTLIDIGTPESYDKANQ